MLRPHEKKALLWAAILVAPFYIIYCITIYGVPVPYMDQWELVPLLSKLYHHQLTFSDLWAQHNEHRIIAPRIVMLTLAKLSGWNIRWEFMTSVAIAGATMLLLFSMLKKAFPERVPAWLLIAFSFLIFAPVQSENWMWGWQIQIFMNVFGVVLAAWALTKWPDRLLGIIIAIAGGFLATYSFSNGLFCWVAIAPVFVMRKPRNWKFLLIWAVAAALAIGMYLWSYIKPANHPPIWLFLDYPGRWLLYALLYVGGPMTLGSGPWALIGAGVLVVIMSIAMLILVLRQDKGKLTVLAPWLCLMMYVVISAFATGVGRIGFGPAQALSSRYTTFASLSIMAIMVMVAMWMAANRQPQGGTSLKVIIVSSVMAAVFVYSYVLGTKSGLGYMEYTQQQRKICMEGLQALPNPNVPDQLLLMMYPHPEMVRERAMMLSELGIIVPKQPALPQPAATR
jgi:hypothetical protein